MSEKSRDMAQYRSKRFFEKDEDDNDRPKVFTFNEGSKLRPQNFECKGCRAKGSRKIIKVLGFPNENAPEYYYFATDPDEFQHICLSNGLLFLVLKLIN